jgi:hypothetical protein
MSKRKSGRVSRRDRKITRHGSKRIEEPVYGIAVPESLHEAIENERSSLAKAASVLRCLMISLECSEASVDGPYYPDVAEIAYELIAQALNGLDSLTLRNCVLGIDRPSGPDDGVAPLSQRAKL